MAFDIQPPGKKNKSEPVPIKVEPVAKASNKKSTSEKIVKKTKVKPIKKAKKEPSPKIMKKSGTKNMKSFFAKLSIVLIAIVVVVLGVFVLQRGLVPLPEAEKKAEKKPVKSGVVQTFGDLGTTPVAPTQESENVVETDSVLLDAHNQFVKNLSAVLEQEVVVSDFEYDMGDAFADYLQEF